LENVTISHFLTLIFIISRNLVWTIDYSFEEKKQ